MGQARPLTYFESLEAWNNSEPRVRLFQVERMNPIGRTECEAGVVTSPSSLCLQFFNACPDAPRRLWGKKRKRLTRRVFGQNLFGAVTGPLL
jgi:hypothetical protein